MITNERVWLLVKDVDDYVVLEFADLEELRTKEGPLKSRATAVYKDKTTSNFENLAGVPSNKSAALAIERCESPDGWAVSEKARTEAAAVLARQRSARMLKLPLRILLVAALSLIAYLIYGPEIATVVAGGGVFLGFVLAINGWW